MSFLSDFDPGSRARSLDRWHYLSNPFPSGAQVMPEVFVDRTELAALKRDLGRFLNDPAQAGGFWALQGARGLGKTNFLRHVEHEIRRLESEQKLQGIAARYLTAKAADPRRIVVEILTALGEQRLIDLLRSWSKAAPSLPDTLRSTDFDRFVSATARVASTQAGARRAYAFLLRWLGGQQTVKEEREEFDVLARDRLPPAVSLPYLAAIIEMLVDHGELRGVVLLIDELEDFQAGGLRERQDFAHTLKSVVNAFNQRRLFLVAAGQAAAFNMLKLLYPSLESRWRRADLLPIQSAEEAVNLAHAYMRYAHGLWLATGRNRKPVPIEQLEPDKKTIEATFARTLPRDNDHRRFLSLLHDEFEKLTATR